MLCFKCRSGKRSSFWYDSAEEVEGSGPELFPHFIFEEGIGDLLIYEYQVRFFKSVNGEVNGSAFQSP